MPKSYSSYSKQRKAIMQQVNRLEKRGYVVKERYHLPTVKELKTMTAKEQASVMRRAKSYTTEKVRQSARMPVYQPTKTGKAKKTTISYEKARKRERAASAKAGAETRARHKKEAEAVEKWRQWHKGDAYYESPSEPTEPITSEPSEPEFITDEKGNIYNAETGEVIHTADRHTIEDTEGNIFDYDTGELLGNRNQYDLYQKAKDEGDVPRGQTFEDWLESVAEDGGAQSYIEGIVEVLDMVNPSVADYVRTESEKYRNANPTEFDKRFIEREGSLPQINDIFGSPRRGSGDISVNYVAIANLMKIITGKSSLSGAQMRAIGKALDQDDYE